MKNTLPYLILFALLSVGLLEGCRPDAFCDKGKDPVESRTLDFESFDNITFGLPGNLFLTEDTAFSIVATGPADLLDKIEFEQIGSQLSISSKKCMANDVNLEIQIHLPRLEQVNLSGSGNVFGLNLFHSSSVEIGNSGSGFLDMGFSANEARVTVTGSGNVDLSLNANSLQADLQGSGDLTLKGAVLSQLISVPGSGDLFAYGMPCSSMEITVSGSGDSQVNVSSQLTATLSGSGDVFYKGRPIILSTITGSGQLVDAN